MYKSYGLLRPLAIVAGTFGILQSLAWIALSTIGIIAYFCALNFRGIIASLGTITELVLFHMYFHGTCAQSGLPDVDYATLDKLNLIRPVQVHICMWIYLTLSVLWLISSITLLTNVRYVNLKNANYFLYIWILLAVAVSILDLGLGVAFGLDYDLLRHEAHNISVDDAQHTDQSKYLIVSGKSAAVIMMIVCFRGFTVWLINIALCIYFFTQTFKITDYNRIKETISNAAFGSPISNALRKSPSNPKNEQWENLHTYGTHTLPTDRKKIEMHRSNQAAKLFEERKRHYEAQQLNYLRYMDKQEQKNRKNRSTKADVNGYGTSQRPMNGHTGYIDSTQYSNKKIREISSPTPMPDYTTNVVHGDSFTTRPPLRSALRASRY